MISDSLREKLFDLSTTDRLDLVEALWDSILGEGVVPDLTLAQREDLDRRLVEADAEPEGGSSWMEAQPRIREQQTRRE